MEQLISDRTAALRNAERQLQRAQKMEALGRLAGGMAHDFNNLLVAIRINGELLRDSLTEQETLCSSATDIVRTVDRAALLTRQLLAIGRTQVSKKEAVAVCDA